MTIFGAISDKMNWLAMRQQIISKNIENINTPHYRAKDIASFGNRDFNSLIVQTTNQSHLSAMTQDIGLHAQEDSRVWETNFSNNNVNLDEQLLKAQNITSEYSSIINMSRFSQRTYLASLK